MLLILIGYLIVGLIFLKRGNRHIQQALQSNDEEEKAALEALGNKNRKIGKIMIYTSIALLVGFLILLGTLR